MAILKKNMQEMPDKDKNRTAVLLLGGNVGDVKKTFEQVYTGLKKWGTISKKSSLYHTAPWQMNDPDYFVNQVVLLSTALNPLRLLENLLELEVYLGRKREADIEKYESRIIDIDILFYGDEVINTDKLCIPHPRLHLRNFTLIPLEEILPSYIHPVLNTSIQELLENSSDQLEVVKL